MRQLIQVCYDIHESETEAREMNVLLKASKEFKPENLIVITRDKEGEEQI